MDIDSQSPVRILYRCHPSQTFAFSVPNPPQYVETFTPTSASTQLTIDIALSYAPSESACFDMSSFTMTDEAITMT